MSDQETAEALRAAICRHSETEANSIKKWYYDNPILIGEDLSRQFSCIANGMHKLVRSIAGDPDRWVDTFGLGPGARRVLNTWDAVPYDPGTYRTDFVFSASGVIKLIEVTCRFALNGFPSNALQRSIGQMQLAESGRDVEVHDTFNDFFPFLAKHLNGKRRIVVLTGADQRNESRFLANALAKSGFSFESLALPDIPKSLEKLEDAFLYSELSLEELASLPDDCLRQLAVLGMLNDPRTMYLVHDKAFFAQICDDKLLLEVLGSEAKEFQAHVLPCYQYTPKSEPMWAQARANREGWILKHRRQGKSQGIHAGILTTPAEWEALFDSDDIKDFILQAFEPQRRLEGKQNGTQIAHYVAGTLLLAGESNFGPGEFRTCEHPISNTGKFHKISGLLVDAPVTDFGGVWI